MGGCPPDNPFFQKDQDLTKDSLIIYYISPKVYLGLYLGPSGKLLVALGSLADPSQALSTPFCYATIIVERYNNKMQTHSKDYSNNIVLHPIIIRALIYLPHSFPAICVKPL